MKKDKNHSRLQKYVNRLGKDKVTEDEIDGKKVFVCANCGNPITNIVTAKRCRFCGEWLVD